MAKSYADIVRDEARGLELPVPNDDEAWFLLWNLTAYPFNCDPTTDHAALREQIRAALRGEVHDGQDAEMLAATP
jgi:hypothetical protein